MTAAVSALLAAQQEGETAAWIQMAGGLLYPPDLAESGVDLDALVVVHIPARAGWYGLPKAAEMLLRSGGYGLVVLDLCAAPAPAGNTAWQSRLLSLARAHQSRLILLTDKPAQAPSVGSLVSLRLKPHRVRQSPGVFWVEHQVLKNKSGLLGDGPVSDERRGPWGLL